VIIGMKMMFTRFRAYTDEDCLLTVLGTAYRTKGLVLTLGQIRLYENVQIDSPYSIR